MKVYPPGIHKVIPHANHLVVVRADGADLLDPMTGQWQRFPSQRTAKWSATVYSRLRQGFGQRVATEELVKREADTITKTLSLETA